MASRTTRLHDRNTKKAHYERLGVPAYWLLDPEGEGALEVLELDADGRYVIAAAAAGDETVQRERPFPVAVSPARLLDGLRR
ncbi:Uma2 family endonuclease [Actinomycetospora cinnamomea]|uniref:Putative restriction endonuclease n=1 Tax=Actinomycetospora cinnamomea TaxID=663609 RepID=A0A2U1EU40_9PSEU|nr:Uma2 family endonuclease [Actinomycetospora cinnamomea]PVZ03429.1 putative restriction endonuclease [Actinomycetospora cinnamomea]